MATRVRVANGDGNQVRLLLDSGAFSAWSRGEEINIKDYIAFLRTNEKYIWNYIGLDIIPGEFGHRKVGGESQSEIERSAKGSYRNHQILKDAGLRPIPVFHQGERLEWLEKYLSDGDDYIGISCNKFIRIDEQMRWLDTIWNILSDREGRPLVKTHGFALTAFPMMTHYPWYTVDSTTWSLTPGYGQIIIPSYVRGEFDYLRTPLRIAISGVMHQSTSSQKKQFEAFTTGGIYQEAIRKFVEGTVGTTIERARYGTNERRKCLLIYYLTLCKHLSDIRFRGNRASITGRDHFDTSKMKALPPHNLILTFATSLNREWSKLMNEVGANDRLLSYYELRTRSPELVAQYVQTGTHGEYQRKPVKNDWDNETYLNRRRLGLIDRLEMLDAQAKEADAAVAVAGTRQVATRTAKARSKSRR